MTLLKKSRFALFSIATGLLLIAFFLLAFNLSVQRHQEGVLQNYLEEICDNAAYMLRTEVKGFSTTIYNEARTIARLGALTDQQLLSELQNCPREKAMLRLHVLMLDGRFFSSVDNTIRQYDPEPYADAFVRAGLAISEPRYSDTFYKDVVEIAVPLYMAGEYVGVLVGCYDLGYFEDLLRTNFLEGDCSISVATSDGTLISHSTYGSTPEAFKKNIFDLYYADGIRFTTSSARELEQNLKQEKGGYAVYHYEGIERFFSYEPIGVEDWYLAAVATDRTLSEQSSTIYSYAFFLVLGVALVVLAISAIILTVRAKEHAMVERILEQTASTDALTKLCNRPAIEARISRFLRKEDAGGLHALLMFDIDGFKQVNDHLGHLRGDELLAEFGQVLRENCPESALLGRIGGDEFLAFVPTCKDLEEVERIAEAVCQAFRQTHSIQAAEAMSVKTSVSVGIAFYTHHGENFHQIYHDADQALYASKHAGRDRYTVYQEGKPIGTPEELSATADEPHT